MQESRLADAGIGVARATAWNGRGGNVLYAVFFLPILFITRILTVILKLIRFNRMLLRVHHAIGLTNRVLYLEVFFPENAGYHYRTRKWADILDGSGFRTRVRHVFDKERYESLLRDSRVSTFHSISLLVRFWHCLTALGFNCVIVRRELLLYNDYGDLFLEKFLLALHPNVVLDFDDDLAAAKREPREITPFGRVMFEHPRKFGESLRLYSRFIVGSSYLKGLLGERDLTVADKDVIRIPTCVDYEQHQGKDYSEQSEYINFGWLGSRSNHYLLDIVTPVLSQIARRHKIRLVLITSNEHELDTDFETVHIPWSLETEIDSLHRIDLGLMPLYDNAEERGKCGFKLIQYMGLGIVSIASAVTANCEIIDDGRNGFLVRRESDWLRVIEDVLARRSEFHLLGAAARQKIQAEFSFEANRQKYLDFISTRVA